MPKNEEIEAALRELVKLHEHWYRGTAYVSVAFEIKNNVAIAEAKRILAELENNAHAKRIDAQWQKDKSVLDLIARLVPESVMAEIQGEINEAGYTHSYIIVDKPTGRSQDNAFSLGDVYVNQYTGACEGAFYGTFAMPLPDGRYFQFSYSY